MIGSKYLLIEKGFINKKSKIIYKPKKKNFSYSIPVTVISSEQGGLIKIKIEKEKNIIIIENSIELTINY